MAANITNEGGAEGRYRVLKNIMGLWLLQRVLKEQKITDLPGLIADTEKRKACTFLIHPNDDRFINPAHMSTEIRPPAARPDSLYHQARPNWRAVFLTALPCFMRMC